MPWRRRFRSGRVLVAYLVVYAVVLVLNPAVHHEIDCHLKSPTHCPSCLTHPAASRAESTDGLVFVSLPSAGLTERFRAARPVAPGLVPVTGRAPPA